MLTVAYVGGGGGQKLPNLCLRNLWMLPMVNNGLKFRFSDIKIEVALEEIGVV